MDFNHDTGTVYNGLQSLDVSSTPPLGGTAGVLTIVGTGAVVLPVGSTAQQPTGVVGMLRFNSSNSVVEYYNGSAWISSTSGTVTSVAATGSTGLTVGGSPITSSGTLTFTLDSELQGMSGLSVNGSVARTGAGTYASRVMTGTANNIVVTHGDGVAGNPTFNLAAVTDSGTGTFKKISTDGFGRVTGTTNVVAADITALVDTTYVNVSGDTMTGALNMGSQLITNLASPVNGTDAANKNYVDTAVTGLSWKQAVRVATTTAGTLATSFANGQTVDGVTLVTGDRILIKNQATQTENGIYIVNASGAPTRTADSNLAAELVGEAVFVDSGTVNADTGWIQTASAPITLGTTNLVYNQFSGSGTYAAGTGLTLTGNTFSLTAPVPVALGGTGLTSVPANGALNIGNGTGFTRATLTAGTAISVTNGSGSITIANTGVTSFTSNTGLSANVSATGAVTVTNTGVLSAAGTAGQVLVNGTSGSAQTGALTLTLPQSIATTSAPTFANITDSGLTAGGAVYAGTSGLLQSTAAMTNGQLLIGSTGASPVAAALTAGTAISVTNASGSITIANTGVTSNVAGTGISVSGATGAVTITNTGVTSIVAGTGISVSGATGAVTINSTGVTSVGLSLPSIFTVTGSPITSSGTLTATLASQTANTVFAAPNGSAGAPSFRAIVAADLPFKLYAENISGQTTATASGTNAVAIGNASVASVYGAITAAGGAISTAGDFTDVKAFFRGITTTATPSELFLDAGGTQRFVLPNNSAVSFKIRIAARRTDAVGGAAGYSFEGIIRKDTTAASTTMTGTPTKVILGETNTSWDVAISADTTNGSLKITVTGEAAKTIHWAAVIDAVVVTN
jgi:hypothetical protein